MVIIPKFRENYVIMVIIVKTGNYGNYTEYRRKLRNYGNNGKKWVITQAILQIPK